MREFAFFLRATDLLFYYFPPHDISMSMKENDSFLNIGSNINTIENYSDFFPLIHISPTNCFSSEKHLR